MNYISNILIIHGIIQSKFIDYCYYDNPFKSKVKFRCMIVLI